MAVYASNVTLGFPPPPHTMTPAAEAARLAVRRYAHERNLARESEGIVTRHGRPKFKAAPASAEALRTAASAKGFEVRVALGSFTVNVGKANEATHPAWTVAGKHELKGVGFRAVWVNGAAHAGTWYSSEGGDECGIGEVKRRVSAL